MDDTFEKAPWTARNAGTKKYIAHPLFPARDARRDHLHVLRNMARFLYNYGYWPSVVELCIAMHGSDRYGVQFAVNNLETMGLTRSKRRPGVMRVYELTPAGFAALGIKPFEAWIKRPKHIVSRVAHKMTVALYDRQLAEQALEQRVGTPLDRLGRRTTSTKNLIGPEREEPTPKPAPRPKSVESGELPPWLLVND